MKQRPLIAAHVYAFDTFKRTRLSPQELMALYISIQEWYNHNGIIVCICDEGFKNWLKETGLISF